MEGEEIGLVLARASEIRAKISDCADRRRDGGPAVDDEGEADEEEEEEAESLLNIRDALESLEHQLSALQALQQQQRYEREATLAQIDRSRKILLSKLKEYKGEELDVIQEAAAFAGEAIDHDDGLLLPPYPAHLPDLFVLDDIYPSSHFSSKRKFSTNGLIGHHMQSKKGMDESEENPDTQPGNKRTPRGLGFFVGLVTKSVVTFLGVVSILSLSGIKPRLRKGCIQFKVEDLFDKPESQDREVSIQCPPGKVLVIEDGEPRCLVKERIEIPFESNITTPNIKYGFG